MEKKKIEIIITSIGVVILIFIVVPKKSHPPSPKASADVRRSVSKGGQIPVTTSETIEKTTKAQGWGRDPFVFGDVKAVSAGGLILNGIVWDEKAPSCIINDKVVNIGDEIDGNRVVDIQKKRVILSKEGSTYELNLLQRAE